MALSAAPRAAAAAAPPPSLVVLLRHGQREDYVAAGEGRGAEWVRAAARPWDPRLADCGRLQAQAAAQRLRRELAALGAAAPSRVFASPLVRCVETAGAVAEEFGVEAIGVEEGLAETVCEEWMRQWALPDSDSSWDGPAGRPKSSSEPGVRAEAMQGPSALLRSAAEIRALGDEADLAAARRVDPAHQSHVRLREADFAWGRFETHEALAERMAATVRARVAEAPGQTMVFVSHGAPTAACYWALTGAPVPEGSGGMTAMSILRASAGGWEALVSNDASHGDEFQVGVRTLF